MQNFIGAHENGDPAIALWQDARRRHDQMDAAYRHLSAVLRAQPRNEQAIGEAQARADALGQRYEQACDEVYKLPATSLEGVLAKLHCATQCIRDILPEGADPEQTCDIELRFVFALERDVRRLIANGRRSMSRRRSGVTSRNRETSSSATGKPARDVGTLDGAGRVT
ncbi:MAG TPA: hypothetical protein VGU20_21775 [Stellaceae bacterium]|nr:hypothetical protein [Stellaceae bacterium]